MKKIYDVIIIGAGPAGLSAAAGLQKSGLRILLLEKNKTIGPKVCAGGLTTKVEQTGLPLQKADIIFSEIVLHSKNKTKTITNGAPIAATIDRSKLGKMMLSNLTKSVEIHTGIEVTEITKNYVTANSERINFRYLVGADGGNSIVRRFVGLKTRKFITAIQYLVPQKFGHLELFFDAELFGSGYAWIFPHKTYTSVGCGEDNRFMENPQFRHNFEFWLKTRQIDVSQAKLEGKIINYDYRGFQFGNIFLAGDAGGFASGLTGEGIYFAIVSGGEIARKIIDPNYSCQEIEHILKIKRTHEIGLQWMIIMDRISDRALNYCIDKLLNVFRYPWITEKSLRLYS